MKTKTMIDMKNILSEEINENEKEVLVCCEKCEIWTRIGINEKDSTKINENKYLCGFCAYLCLENVLELLKERENVIISLKSQIKEQNNYEDKLKQNILTEINKKDTEIKSVNENIEKEKHVWKNNERIEKLKKSFPDNKEKVTKNYKKNKNNTIINK